MPIATALSRAEIGLEALDVTVEAHLAAGLPRFSIVGLPQTAVRESRDRVRAAIQNSGFEFPDAAVTINLAPAEMPKQGGRYDLAIALAILAARGVITPASLRHTEFIGELGLAGDVRAVPGVIPAIIAADRASRVCVVPDGNRVEAGLFDATVYTADRLGAVIEHLRNHAPLPTAVRSVPTAPPPRLALDDVRGQPRAKRALNIAAAGAHSLLLIGPPGTGKTMLANRLPDLLPAPRDDEALEIAALGSLTGRSLDLARFGSRPFRAPHHTASGPALVGGGSVPRPGEASLAHHGVLFLDELPEFSRSALEALREPLECGEIVIARTALSVSYPARFQLVAAMNPCPCGHAGDPLGRCSCSQDAVRRYRGRISGPLLDRIDLHVEVTNPDTDDDAVAAFGPTGRDAVAAARARALERQAVPNAQLSPAATEQHCAPTAGDSAWLARAIRSAGLSTRARHRVMRVARSIADLDGRDAIERETLLEALSFRQLDRPPVGASALTG